MNIVDLLKNQMGNQLPGMLGGLLGTNADAAKGALGAGLPAVLAGITGAASTPEGARRLNDAVDAADDGILGKLGGMGGNLGGLVSGGSNVLGSLLGGGMLSSLVGVLGKFTGLGGGAASLLGLLAPLILGFLKNQKRTMGLDANGLASMLASQKGNIMGAMPAGLGNMLGSVPGMQGFASQAPAPAPSSGKPNYTGAQSGGGGLGKLLVPLLLLAGLGVAAWYFMSKPATPTVPNAPSMPKVDAPKIDAPKVAVPSLPDPVAAIKTQVTGFFDGATKTLGGITDAKGAEAAIPALEGLGTSWGGLTKAYGALPDTAKGGVMEMIKGQAGGFTGAIDKVLKLPGLSDKVKPILDGILKQFKTFIGM